MYIRLQINKLHFISICSKLYYYFPNPYKPVLGSRSTVYLVGETSNMHVHLSLTSGEGHVTIRCHV